MANLASHASTLEITALVKDYPNGERAVDGVTLRVNEGEFLTLLGPSGSGKSTTLNLIAGFTKATAGEITLGGQPIGAVAPHRRNIGVVFQHYALFPHLSVAGNVAFPLKRRKVPRADIESKVAQALKLVELQEYAHRRPRQLSGGQQQRVALARAVVFDPPLLLMDEPLGALDRKLRDSLQRQIRRLHRELGVTIIYVTHDQDEAMVLSDRIAIFNNGTIEQIGSPRELYEAPRTSFCAQFLGESNFFEGNVEAGNLVCSGGARIALPSDLEHGRTSAAVSIRPEHVRVAGPDEPDRLRGIVRDTYYLGVDQRCEVEIAGGQRVVMRLAAAGREAVREGDEVQLAWDDEHVVVLADAPARA
jgi:putative spermidine/putrescine transport system ATP-binding protein